MQATLYLDDPARLFWCRHAPGQLALVITIPQVTTDGVAGPDPSTATAGAILVSRDGGLTSVPWLATLTTDGAAKTATLRHSFGPGDLASRDVGQVLDLDFVLTIAGLAEPCVSRKLRVIA